MKKKLLVPITVLGLILIPNGIILAQQGIDGYQAYLKALEYALLGLKEYFACIIEIFKLAIGA